MINSAIIEDLHDRNQRYMYISFGTDCTKYGWYRDLLDVMPSVASLDGTSGADTFISWMQRTSVPYKIVSVFANTDFTNEVNINDYPELFI